MLLFFEMLSIPAYYDHLVLFFICAGWSYSMVKHCLAIYSAIAVFMLGVLQMILSIDLFVFGATPTGLSNSFSLLVFSSHALIIMASYVDGVTIHTSSKYRSGFRSETT